MLSNLRGRTETNGNPRRKQVRELLQFILFVIVIFLFFILGTVEYDPTGYIKGKKIFEPVVRHEVKAVKREKKVKRIQYAGSGVERWRPLVAKYFGSATDEALAIMKCESGGNPNAVNYNSNSVDRGLMQVNSCHGAGSTFDPEGNIAYSYRLYRSSGWRPWVCARKIGIIR